MRLKKLFLISSIIFTLCLAFGIIANAETEGIYTYTVSNGEATITDCDTSASGDIVIPEILDGYPVIGIGDSAFYSCIGLTNITIPEDVTSIGEGAFYNCTGLTEINWNAKSVKDFSSKNCIFAHAGQSSEGINVIFGDSVEYIPAYMFKPYVESSSFPKIKAISIGDNVTSIGQDAFGNCAGLTAVTIPDSVTSIGSSAFRFCTGLTSVTIGDSVTTIGESAFSWCDGLTSITIPENVTSIGSNAFYGCTGLTQINWNAKSVEDFSNNNYPFAYTGQNSEGINVIFGDNVEYIPAYLFYSNSSSSYLPNIKSIIIGENVTNIGEYAFHNCTGLTEINWNAKSIEDFSTFNSIFAYAGQSGDGINVIFSDNVEHIPAYVFYNCNTSINITIGENVTSVGKYAFYGCSGLTSITIPESVTSIGDYAFNCTGLTQINWNAKNVSDFSSSSYVFGGRGIKLVFGDSVDYIPAYVFYNCDVLISITIGENVTSVGRSAFYGCSGLTSITIPESATSIGNYAFYNCTDLTEINWNAKSVENFSSKNYVFAYAGQNAEGINVTFGDGVEHIPAYVFHPYSSTSYNPKITSVTIGKNVTSVGWNAFYDCPNLENLYYPSNITDWCKISFANAYANPMYCVDNVFINGKKITDLIIPESVTAIYEYTFYGFSSLTSITMPNSITNIGDSAFSGCTSLESITIPEGVTNIGDSAFSGCSGLTSITIFESVTNIGASAFSGCSGLTSITIPKSVTSIGNSAFNNCKGLIEINWNVKKVNDFSSGNNVFAYAGQNAEGINVIFGDSVEYIPAYIFYQYSSSYSPKIKSVTIGENVTRIGNYAFHSCSSLESINMPESVTCIGDYTFYDCIGLTSITISENVTSIGRSAFYNCTDLTEINWNAKNVEDFSNNNYIFAYAGQNAEGINVIFSDNVEHIPAYAFYSDNSSTSYVPNIASVTIGKNVTTIGNRAFYSCTNLNNASILSDKLDYVSGDIFYGSTFYNNEENWINGTLIAGNWIIDVKEDTTGIYTMPEGCLGVAENAFEDCSNIRAVKVNTIEDWIKICFSNRYANPTCHGVDLYIGESKLPAEIDVPDGVKRIGNYAFYGFDEITKVNIPDGVITIGDSAFRGCVGLTNISVPDSVTSIGEYAFYNCCFSDIVLPESLNIIGEYAFSDCRYLNAIKIPDSLTELGGRAFEDCTQLRFAVIGDGLTEINSNVFSDCAIEVMVIPSGITNIAYGAFYRCDLETVVISKSVTSIDENAFYNCNKLTDVYYEGTELEWLSLPINVSGNDYLLNANIHYGEYVPLAGLAFDKTTVKLSKNQSITITPIFAPDNATIKNLYWQSSNSDIVTVDENGQVKGIAEGEATITARSADGGFIAECVVTASGIPGDINGDTSTNIQDVIQLLKHVNGSQVMSDLSMCDLNNDGKVNIQDVIRLLKHVNNSEPLY